jgi:cysteine synthase
MLALDAAAAAAQPRYFRLAKNLVGVQFPLMKLAPASVLVAAAPPNAPLIETSSGTMGLALAIVAAKLGRSLTLVMPPLSQSLALQLAALGRTEIVTVRGDQNARLARLWAMLASQPALHWTDQYSNPLVPAAYESVGFDLAELGIDTVVAPVGSGGSAVGIIQSLRKMRPRARLVAVDTLNSILFGRPDGPRCIPGIGNSLMPTQLDHSLFDTIHWLSDALYAAHARRLARNDGLFIGPSGAGALKVAQWHAIRDQLPRMPRYSRTRVTGTSIRYFDVMKAVTTLLPSSSTCERPSALTHRPRIKILGSWPTGAGGKFLSRYVDRLQSPFFGAANCRAIRSCPCRGFFGRDGGGLGQAKLENS